jgi:hypothetical protein
MTIPYERYKAVVNTEKFLLELLDSKLTPKVPKHIRQQAKLCLRHYPSQWIMDLTSEVYPDMWTNDFNNGDQK